MIEFELLKLAKCDAYETEILKKESETVNDNSK